jgi:hypothetical protein
MNQARTHQVRSQRGGEGGHRELLSYSKNITSQFGENGILEEVLRRISGGSPADGWCVEVGAADGIRSSNTYPLIADSGFKAVLIEASPKAYEALCKNIPRDDVFKIREFVSFEGRSTLDNILGRTPIPGDFDLLSIDIDGYDYFVLESLTNYQPKIICIEYNHSIPNEIEFVQPRNTAIRQGSSARSITRLAGEKDYALVAITTANLIFVRNDLASDVLGDHRPSLDELRDDSHAKTFLFFGYDGTILSNRRELQLPWHEVTHRMSEIQFLPKVLRKRPADYRLFERILFLTWMALRKPANFKPKLANRINRYRWTRAIAVRLKIIEPAAKRPDTTV